MPKIIEQIFRYLFLYTGIYVFIIGVRSIFWGFFLRTTPTPFAPTIHFEGFGKNVDPVFLILTFVIVWGLEFLFGLLLIVKFRKFANWAVRQIEEYTEKTSTNWYDVIPFSVFLSIALGLYFLLQGLNLLSWNWERLLYQISAKTFNFHSFGTLSIQEWQNLLIPVLYIVPGVVLILFSGKIGKMVESLINRTEPSDNENLQHADDVPEEGNEA